MPQNLPPGATVIGSPRRTPMGMAYDVQMEDGRKVTLFEYIPPDSGQHEAPPEGGNPITGEGSYQRNPFADQAFGTDPGALAAGVGGSPSPERKMQAKEAGLGEMATSFAGGAIAGAPAGPWGALGSGALNAMMSKLFPSPQTQGGDFAASVSDYATWKFLQMPAVAEMVASRHPLLRPIIRGGTYVLSAAAATAGGQKLQAELTGEDVPIASAVMQNGIATGMFAVPSEALSQWLTPEGLMPSVVLHQARRGADPNVPVKGGGVESATARMQGVLTQAGLPEVADKFKVHERMGSKVLRDLGEFGAEEAAEETKRLSGVLELMFANQIPEDKLFKMAAKLELAEAEFSKDISGVLTKTGKRKWSQGGSVMSPDLEDLVQQGTMTMAEAERVYGERVMHGFRDTALEALSGKRTQKIVKFKQFMEHAQKSLSKDEYAMLSDELVNQIVLYPAYVREGAEVLQQGGYKAGSSVPSLLSGKAFGETVDRLDQYGVIESIWGPQKGQVLRDMAEIIKLTDPQDIAKGASVISRYMERDFEFLRHRAAFKLAWGGAAAAGAAGASGTLGAVPSAAGVALLITVPWAVKKALASNGRAVHTALEALQRNDHVGFSSAFREAMGAPDYEPSAPVLIPDEMFQ